MTFKDRIHQSAKRISARQNARLHVPANPCKSGTTYWGWVATPAAAVVGIALGLSLQHHTVTETVNTAISEIAGQPVHDTVYVTDVRHDTLWLTRIKEKVRYVEREAPANTVATTTAPSDDVCTSVSCDGINYAILASN